MVEQTSWDLRKRPAMMKVHPVMSWELDKQSH
jgi:hypothetical protein